MNYKLPVNGKWKQFSDEKILTLPKRDQVAIRGMLDTYEKNPLAQFLPHGVPWSSKERVYGDGAVTIQPSDYPKEYDNDGVAFQNDWVHDVSMLVALNQGEKLGWRWLVRFPRLQV